VSEYPKQPLPRDGWPEQPPLQSNPDTPDGPTAAYGVNAFGQASYDQASYNQGSYNQGGVLQNGYGQAGQYGGQAGPAGAGYSDYGQRAPRRMRRRRRGRGWIGLLVTLIVLVVAFVIADQYARSYAQNMIAAKFQTSAGMATKPSVTIEGFPFLTQVASHDIRTVDINASDVPADKIHLTSVKAKATGVHLNSSFTGATIDHISGTALVTFATLVNAAGAQGVTVSADPADGPNAAHVSAGPFTATASIRQTGPNQITVKMDSLAGIAASFIGQLPDYTFIVPRLPAGLQLQGVSVTSEGILIAVAAQHTTLSQ
jgi:hypothetical protein